MANEKLIDANEVKKKLRVVKEWFNVRPSGEHEKLAQAVVKMCIEEIGKIKPVEAVEVVRCKDCKYCRLASWGERYCIRDKFVEWGDLKEDDFCSFGEKMAKDGK